MCFPKALQVEIIYKWRNIKSKTIACITVNYPNDIGRWDKHNCGRKSSLENNFLVLYYCSVWHAVCHLHFSFSFPMTVSLPPAFSSCLFVWTGEQGECEGYLSFWFFSFVTRIIVKRRYKRSSNLFFILFGFVSTTHTPRPTHHFLGIASDFLYHIPEKCNEVCLVLNT